MRAGPLVGTPGRCPCWRSGTQTPGDGPRPRNQAKALAQQALGELGSPGELGLLSLAPAVGFSGTHSGSRETARAGCPRWRPGTQPPGYRPRTGNQAKALAQQALAELGSPGGLGSLSLVPVPVQPPSLGQCCLAAPAATPAWASAGSAGAAGHGRMLASTRSWLVRAGCLAELAFLAELAESWRLADWPRLEWLR